jgi:hypothetical protein
VPTGQQELSLGVPAVPGTPRYQGPYTDGFERLWRLHPRGGKRGAFRAYLKVVPQGVTQAEAERCLALYVGRLRRDFRGAHLSTWLNQEYWQQEEPEDAARPTGRRVRSNSAARFY